MRFPSRVARTRLADAILHRRNRTMPLIGICALRISAFTPAMRAAPITKWQVNQIARGSVRVPTTSKEVRNDR